MTVSEKGTVESPPKRLPILGLLITMILVAVSVGGAVVRGGESIPFIVGNTVTTATIGWCILWFGFVSRSGHKVAGRYWLLLFAAGIAAGVSVVSYQKSQVRAGTASLRSGYSDLLQGKQDIASKPKAKGEFGEIEGLLLSLMKTNANDQRDYQSELAGAGFDDILSIDSIKADPQFTQSKFKVKRAREIVQKYRDLYASRIAGVHEMIDKTTLSENSKAQAKIGFDNGMAENRGLADRIWDLDESMVSEIGACIDLLARARGSWRVEADQINFERQADIDAFNVHTTKIQAMLKEQEEIQSRAQSTTKAKLADLETLGK